uniref:GRANULINS domain-containing protein n=1 Tax=Caenorhabditis tropicalis TaxID=1561998 RepID=A0A1I7UB82_9PELO
MHSVSLIALLALIAGASAQCFGGGCGGPIFLPPPPCFGGNCGCSGNNCGPQVSVISIPNKTMDAHAVLAMDQSVLQCATVVHHHQLSFSKTHAATRTVNFSCCPFRFRRHNTDAESTEEGSTAAPVEV